jgi:nucleotide-binding universal stress UspA family protein
VPYDSSKASNRALSYAVKVAKMSRDSQVIHKHDHVITIILLHVLSEIPLPLSFGGIHLRMLSEKTGERITFKEYLKEAYQEMKGSAIKMLKQKIEEYDSDTEKLNIKLKVSIGLPADKIMETANEENVNLIIIGTAGLTGVSKIKALGSVARNISERAKCPVMLVR